MSSAHSIFRRMTSFMVQVESYMRHPSNPKPLQLLYSSTSDWPFASGSSSSSFRPTAASRSTSQSANNVIDIGVLDSSFNPPQLAHFALATGKKPTFDDNDDEQEKTEYDAILLLFSVRNADKGTGTSRDASTIQRLEMMRLLAKDVERQNKTTNVAVGIVEEPLMISKSTLIHQFIQHRRNSLKSVEDYKDEYGDKKENKNNKNDKDHVKSSRLHWLVGFDTLERFFQVKYYPSPESFANSCEQFFVKEKTTFVCARRGIDSLPNKQQQQSSGSGSTTKAEQDDNNKTRNKEEEFLQSDLVKPWMERKSIVMIDLDENVQGISSTAVRQTMGDANLSDQLQAAKLRQMTTQRVCDYLLENPVYGSSKEEEKKE